MSEETKPSKLPYVATAIIALLLIVAMCAFQLRVSEVAIVTTFARPAVVSDPGLHFRLPWPAQKVARFDKRSRVLTGPREEITTGDSVNLIIRPVVAWRISDHLEFFKSLGTTTEAESALKTTVSSLIRTTFADYQLDDFVGVDAGDGLAKIEVRLQKEINAQLPKDYGIDIEMVGVLEMTLPESNTGSVIDRMKRERATTAEVIQIEGQTEADIIRDKADSEKASTIAEAEAAARKIRGDALIAMTDDFETFNKDLELALLLRKVDALKKITQDGTTFILDPTIPPFDVMLMGAGKSEEH